MYCIRYEMRTKQAWKIATLHTLRNLQHDIDIFHPAVILAGKKGRGTNDNVGVVTIEIYRRENVILTIHSKIMWK